MNLLERQQTGSYGLWRSFVSELTSCSSLKTAYPEECHRIHFPLARPASLFFSFSLCFIPLALVFRPFLVERAATHLPTETERGGGQRRTGGEQERVSNQRARPSALTLGANQRSAKNKDWAVSCWAQSVRVGEDFHLRVDWQAKVLSKTGKTFNTNTTRYIAMTENLESPYTESALALWGPKQNSDKGPSYPECRPSAKAKW